MQRGYIRNPSPSLINVERHHGSRLCSTGAESSTGPRDSDFQILRQSVLQHFQTLPDPRVERTQHHSLMSIVTIAILAVLAGADGFVANRQSSVSKCSAIPPQWTMAFCSKSSPLAGRIRRDGQHDGHPGIRDNRLY